MNVFVARKGESVNIVESQMIPVINRLNELNLNTKLAVHSYDKNKYRPSGDIIVYKNIIALSRMDDIDYFYIRTVFEFLKLFCFRWIFNRGFKLLFDFRALVSEESFLLHKSRIRKAVLAQIEKFIYLKADRVHAVSHVLRKHLNSKYGIREVKVIPCCTSKNYLKDIKKSDEIKFVYVGGMSKWQRFDAILDVFKGISEDMKNTSLTVITTRKEHAERLLKDKKIASAEVKSLSHAEVIEDLRKYDFGFLLRDNILLNNVASPIKFIEYISQGLIPIISIGVGDYSELVNSNSIGAVLNLKNKKLDTELLNTLIHDQQIHKKLYELSGEFLWEENINKDFFQ
ncbi:MAG: hypothetical protein U5O15_07610 [Candidatus Krumholzibacteriota bacterium]|nr:hypothetical protein [Candidatus Krumholzibacteriota bacterium]